MRVLEGPFVGLLGTVVSADDDTLRVIVDIEIDGHATPVDFEQSQVEKV